MNLERRLTELRRNMLKDYSSLIEGESDSLWDDEALLSYIADADRRFARKTLILRDKTTPEVVEVELVEGQSDYLLHPSVLAVISTRYDADTFDLHRIGHTLISLTRPDDTAYFDPSNVSGLQPGRPTAVATDEALVQDGMSQVTLTIYPAPTAAESGKLLKLRVARLPLTDYSLDNLNAECEFPDDYQFDILNWAAYRALRNQDADAGSPLNAETFKTRFEECVTEAIREAKRKLSLQVSMRFGANGFSWTR